MMLLGAIGLHWIIKYGKPLAFIREPLKKNKYLNDLFNCSLCLGTWVGVLLTMIFSLHVMFICASAAVCYIADRLVDFLDRN